MSDYAFDQRCLQTLALVAWVRQQVEKDVAFYEADYGEYVGTVESATYYRLIQLYDATLKSDHHEYLRLVAGCPHEFKNRVFVDNAPDNWTFASNRPTNHHRRLWKEMGS